MTLTLALLTRSPSLDLPPVGPYDDVSERRIGWDQPVASTNLNTYSASTKKGADQDQDDKGGKD